MAKNDGKSSGKASSASKSGKQPSAKDKAQAMRSASLHPDGKLATSGAARRIQAAHDRKQAKK